MRISGARMSGAITLIAAMSITIVRAPYLVGYTPLRGLIVLLPLIWAIAWMHSRPRQHSHYRSLLILTAGFILLVAIALYRGNRAGVAFSTLDTFVQSTTLAVVGALGVMLFTTARTEAETRWRLVAVAVAPAVYVGVNVVLYFAGFEAQEVDTVAHSYALGAPAQLLGAVGIHATRIALPLNPSINGLGVVAAAGFASSALLVLRLKGRERQIGQAGMAASVVAVLLTDTRAAFTISVVVILFLMFVKRPRIAVLLGALIPFSFLLVRAVVAVLSAPGIAQLFSRKSGDFLSGTNRFYIWDPALSAFGYSDALRMLVGYGANGQVSSGATLRYAYLFNDTPDAYSVHTHNLAIQMLLDTGLIGLLLLVVAVVVAAHRLELLNRLSPRSPIAALLAGMLVVFISGSTEVSPTYRTQEMLVFAILLLGATAGLATPTAAVARHAQRPSLVRPQAMRPMERMTH